MRTAKLTDRRSAAEIDELFEEKVPAWRWSKTVTSVEEELKRTMEARNGRIEGA